MEGRERENLRENIRGLEKKVEGLDRKKMEKAKKRRKREEDVNKEMEKK